MDMQTRISAARTGAARFLDSLLMPELGFGVHRDSLWEGGGDFPGMLLPGTYNAIACRFLIRSWTALPDPAADSLAAYLCASQTAEGAFRLEGMEAKDIYYPDFEYDDLHITNYALGALDLLGRRPKHGLAFAQRYTDLTTLDGWLAKRDFGEPWTEGNYFVNVASLLAQLASGQDGGELRPCGDAAAKAGSAFARLLEWHDAFQCPATGFWADPDRTDLTSAMAGAAHNLHLYFLAGREVPRYERIVDSCLGLVRGKATTACLDIDAVDILANLHAYGYRTADIEEWLEAKLEGLLDFQNPDGGFPDAIEGERLFDGWESYREPQGISNAFATWFRMASIGMAASILYPDTRQDWRFRNTIGIGYFSALPPGQSRRPAWLPPFSGRPRFSATEGYWSMQMGATDPLSPAGRTELAPTAIIDAILERLANAKIPSLAQAAGYYRFELGDMGAFTIVIDSRGGRLPLPGDEIHKPNLTLRLTAADLESLLAGKLNATAAYMRKKLRLSGDITKAFILQGLLKG
jgi:hypothetical protein